MRIRSMPAPASRRGALPASCPTKGPITSRAARCQHLPSPIAAKVRPYPAGNLFNFGIQRLWRCFRFLRSGSSALLRLPATQVFPQLHGQPMAALSGLPGIALLGRARHGRIIGPPPDVANLIHCLRHRGSCGSFRRVCAILFSARPAAVAQW
jgi:hypothetical protein